MESQDPPNPNPNPPTRGPYHRRSQSEVQYRIPDDMDLVSDPISDPLFDGPGGSEDDLFCSYMDMDKIGSKPTGDDPKHENANVSVGARPRHRYSNSIDGTTSSSSVLESIEAKKAMDPDKLAELWTVDPKRAKRWVFFSPQTVVHLRLFCGMCIELIRKRENWWPFCKILLKLKAFFFLQKRTNFISFEVCGKSRFIFKICWNAFVNVVNVIDNKVGIFFSG